MAVSGDRGATPQLAQSESVTGTKTGPTATPHQLGFPGQAGPVPGPCVPVIMMASRPGAATWHAVGGTRDPVAPTNSNPWLTECMKHRLHGRLRVFKSHRVVSRSPLRGRNAGEELQRC